MIFHILFLTSLPSCSLVLLAQGHMDEAYSTCSSILSQLGETVPEAVPLETVGSEVQEILKRYSEVYGDDWLGKKMKDTTLCYTMKFYTLIATATYFSKSLHMVAYFICKAVQLSLQHGVCKYTPRALMIMCSFVIQFDNAAFVR